MNLYVIYGGQSIEHEVSIISASSVLNSLDRDKYKIYPVFINKEGKWCPYGRLEEKVEDLKSLELHTDLSLPQSLAQFIASIDPEEENLVFPVLHGNNGEDGTIQGLLELLDLPYVGNEVLASALAMDKVSASDVFKAQGIPQANYTSLRKHQWLENKDKALKEILEKVKLPVFVKPANAGSSVGISRAASPDELVKSIDLALIYDVRLLIQEEIRGREVETCIIGNNKPLASLSGELEMEEAFYDYEAKYIKKAALPLIPARLDPDLSQEVRDLALKVYEVLDCRGIARVDIFISDENEILVNEVNTMPGFTSISMAPMLWEKTDGSNFSELIDRLIAYALERYEEKSNLSKVKVTD